MKKSIADSIDTSIEGTHCSMILSRDTIIARLYRVKYLGLLAERHNIPTADQGRMLQVGTWILVTERRFLTSSY